jgi:hypothetical protein
VSTLGFGTLRAGSQRNCPKNCRDKLAVSLPFPSRHAVQGHFYRRLFKGADCLCSGAVARHFPVKPINLSKTSSELAVTN